MSGKSTQYQAALEAYFNQKITCPECNSVLSVRDWPIVPSTGKLKRTCCLQGSGANKKRKYKNRQKLVNGELLFLCYVCESHKKQDEFHKAKKTIKSICKKCHSERYKGYLSPSDKKIKDETRKRKLFFNSELITCKRCGKQTRRKYFPKEKSGKLAETCCGHLANKFINKKLAKRRRRMCGSCNTIKDFDEFHNFKGKPRNPCKTCRKLFLQNNGSTKNRAEFINQTSDGTLNPKTLNKMFCTSKSCLVCFNSMRWDDKTLDHIMPLARGGAHSITNAIIMCRTCNSKKWAKLPNQWFQSLSNESKQSVWQHFTASKHLNPEVLL